MAKFKFRLATLLRLREVARDERRTELAEAYRADDVLQEQLDHVAAQLGRLQGRCRKAGGAGPVDIDRLVEAQRYGLTLRNQQHQLGRQRHVIAAEIERRHQALVGANRDVRVLEKLREKQAARHRQEESRQESKQLDEVAGQRAAREETR